MPAVREWIAAYADMIVLYLMVIAAPVMVLAVVDVVQDYLRATTRRAP